MIEIKRFRTNSPYTDIPEALRYSQENKCDIELSVGLSGVGEIVMCISGIETVDILHARLKEATEYIHQKFKDEVIPPKAGDPHSFLKDGSKINNPRLGTHVVKGP